MTQLAGRTVLLADDSAVVRAVLREQLGAEGFTVLMAADGAQALTQCRVHKPDLVLLDVDMPARSGHEVMTALAESAETNQIPVVFLTGRVNAADAVEGLRLGAHDYLRKPVEPIELIARVSAALRLKDLQDELRRRNAQLEHTNAELHAANRLAADLVAMLSHDVRQPLTTVIGNAEILTDDWQSTSEEQKRRCADRIRSSARMLNDLVTDVLTMAQLDAAAMPTNRTVVPVAECLRHMVAAMGMEADVRFADGGNPRALVDRGHLQQMLANLLGNARKYGAPPIDVTVAAAGDAVRIRISDHGEGVPAEFAEHLFDRFTRATTGTATTKNGTGLGLFIVRQLAVANGGDIAYEPNRPTGATFVVRLEPSN
jgi:signal transduction histidine kinase